jgi:hypothetical protein
MSKSKNYNKLLKGLTGKIPILQDGTQYASSSIPQTQTPIIQEVNIHITEADTEIVSSGIISITESGTHDTTIFSDIFSKDYSLKFMSITCRSTALSDMRMTGKITVVLKRGGKRIFEAELAVSACFDTANYLTTKCSDSLFANLNDFKVKSGDSFEVEFRRVNTNYIGEIKAAFVAAYKN